MLPVYGRQSPLAQGGAFPFTRKAAQFSGSNYLSHAFSSRYRMNPAGKFTVAVWGRIAQKTAANQYFVSSYSGLFLQYAVAYSGAADRFFSFWGGPTVNTQVFSSGPAPVLNQWYLLLAESDGTGTPAINISVNNGAPDVVAWAGGDVDRSYDFLVGNRSLDLARPLLSGGMAGSVQVFQSGLTAGQKAEIYGGGRPKRFSRLSSGLRALCTAAYDLDGALTDQGGGSLTLTNNNSVIFAPR